MRKILAIHNENCESKCSRQVEKSSKCCQVDCIYREAGVLVNGVLNDGALLKLYENYLDDNGAGKYDQWMKVVETSIKKCVDLSKKISSSSEGIPQNFPFQFHIQQPFTHVTLPSK